jgi:hypothetical protein
MFDYENKVLEKKMIASLHKIGRYRVVDRSEDASNKLAAEHIKQRNGSVDEEQIKRLGKQYGVDFICIVDITSAFGGFLVSASIVDVETAAVHFAGETSSKHMALDDLSRALNEVLEMMFSGQPTTAQTQETVNAQGQMLMKAKYDDTEIYATEYFAASGSPVAIVGPKDVLTVLQEGKNYYKVRTALGKEGFAVKRDLVSSIAQFVDMRPEAPPATRREAAERKRKEAEKRANPTTYVVTQRQETPVASQRQEKPVQVEVPDDRPRVLGNRIGIELGFGLGQLGGSGSASVPSLESYSKFPDTSTVDGPVKIHIDLIYVDIYGYGFGGYGLQTNSHILGKYPINIGPVKVSPLLGYSQSQALQAIRLGLVMTGGSWLSPQFKFVDIGFEDNQFTTGGRVDIGLSKSAYMSTEYLYSIGAGSDAQSFKLSSGFDLGIGKRKRWYWRPELMYQYTRTAYNDKATMSGTIPEVSMDGTKYERSTHFFGLYVGIGYKWGGNNQTRSTSEVKPVTPPPIQAPSTPPPPPPAQPRGSATPSSGFGADGLGADDW